MSAIFLVIYIPEDIFKENLCLMYEENGIKYVDYKDHDAEIRFS